MPSRIPPARTVQEEIVVMTFTLIEQFPDFGAELAALLRQEGEDDLAATVPNLTIVDRCRCGDDFCSTMYTVSRPVDSWGRSHRNVALHSGKGELILDILDFEIVCIEVLFRDEIRSRLLELMP